MAMYAKLVEGNVIPSSDVLEWARWFESADKVALTEIGEGVRVSTVFLGINYDLSSTPLWFETMVFGGDHDQFCEHYSTLEQAVLGHERIVRMVKGE